MGARAVTSHGAARDGVTALTRERLRLWGRRGAGEGKQTVHGDDRSLPTSAGACSR